MASASRMFWVQSRVYLFCMVCPRFPGVRWEDRSVKEIIRFSLSGFFLLEFS